MREPEGDSPPFTAALVTGSLSNVSSAPPHQRVPPAGLLASDTVEQVLIKLKEEIR